MARRPIQYRRRDGGGVAPHLHWPEKSAQTYKKGVFLTNDAGFAAAAGTDGTNILMLSTHQGQGLGTSGDKKAHGIKAGPGVLFEGTLDNNGDLGNEVIAAADLGAEYGLTVDSAGIMYVDKGKTGSDGRVKITDLIDPIGTVMGRVEFEVTYDHLHPFDS